MKLSLLGNIIDFLFPRYCAICDERLLGTEEMLCATCLQDLPITPTWEAPYENNMAKMFWGRIPIENAPPSSIITATPIQVTSSTN